MADTLTSAPSPAAHPPTTYHCLCTNLLLTTTTPLSTLARRASPPARDAAYILPVPALPPRLAARVAHPSRSPSPSSSDSEGGPASAEVTVLLAVAAAARAVVVQREDGFEKRWVLRCARCGLAVGYRLDWAQWDERWDGCREDVVYLLPGAVVTTEEMAAGQRPAEEEVSLGLGGEG